MSDRLARFPGSSWQEIEALPQPLRWTGQRTIVQNRFRNIARALTRVRALAPLAHLETMAVLGGMQARGPVV